MPNSNLQITHAYFKQQAIARLMLQGMWFSDALAVMHIIWPERTLPPDWEDSFYDTARDYIGDQHIPMPPYKPIW